MKYKFLYLFVALHAMLGLSSFVWLQTVGLAAADAGRSAPVPELVTVMVHYVLLQPLAHWVLSRGIVIWWTWPGLVALAAVVFCNSLIVGLLGRLGIMTIGRRESGRRHH